MNETSSKLGPRWLLTFSGLDGAGKSTQIELLRGRLRARGLETTVVWVRGGYTPFFTRLKSLARRAAGRRLPPSGPGERRSEALGRPWVRRAWLAAALLDLAWLLGVRVRILRRRGRIVLCDRYLVDTLIDFRLNFLAEQVERWWLWRAVERLAPHPDATFVLLVPVAESERRSDLKGEPFRDSREVLSARLAHYRALAPRSQCTILDGSQPAAEIAATIAAAIGLPPSNADAHQSAA